MKAWRVNEVNKISLDEMAAQSVGQNCVKLKMTYSSISLTDKLIYQGKLGADKMPLILGRQGVGMVTEVGEGVTGVQRGDRVAIEPYIPCGVCVNCKAGKTNECEKMLIYGVNENGFLCDFAVVSENDIYKLPERVKDNEAIFLEHIALALNTFAKLKVEKGGHIVIVGANVVGLILAQIALYHQAVPILVDTRQDRLALAESLGDFYTINSVDTDVQKKIFSLTGGHMAEAVAHMAYSAMPLKGSLEYACRGGRVVLAGWNGVETELKVSLMPLINKQLSLYGLNNGAKYIASAINMLANKSVTVAPLITKEATFLEVDKIIAEMVESPYKYLKVLIKAVQ